jgi:hypothetical protein
MCGHVLYAYVMYSNVPYANVMYSNVLYANVMYSNGWIGQPGFFIYAQTMRKLCANQ